MAVCRRLRAVHSRTQVKPIGSGTSRAASVDPVVAFFSADHTAAEEILRDATTLAQRTLAARLSLRLAWSLRGLEILEAAELLVRTETELAEFYILRGALHTQERDFGAARTSLDNGRFYAFGAEDRAVEAEYHFYETLLAFAGGDLAGAEAAANAAIHADLEYGVSSNTASTYFVPIANTRSRAIAALGVIAGAREDYHRQAHYYRTAVDIFRKSGLVDDWTYSTLLMNLSISARDLDLPNDADTVIEALGRTWTPYVGRQIFEMQRSIGWQAALTGDETLAGKRFVEASWAAPSRAFEIIAQTDQAYFARERDADGDGAAFARLERLAAEVDWERTGEERYGLIAVVRELAARGRDGRRFLERYRRLTSRLDPGLLNNRDRRLVAYERLAEGFVFQTEGQLAEATRAFVDAFEIWNEVGYRWLAATASLQIVALTGSPQFMAYARREAARRPDSWLARRAADLELDRPLVTG